MAPLNNGREPEKSVILKVFSGKVFEAPRGSLRSLRVSSPVLVMVVVTSKFSNPSTLTLGVEALIVRLGVADTTTAEATKVKRGAKREEENIVVKAARVVETLGLEGHGLSTLPTCGINWDNKTKQKNSLPVLPIAQG